MLVCPHSAFGTIYESRLAPLCPFTTLPPPSHAPAPALPSSARPALQAEFWRLVEAGEAARLERLLTKRVGHLAVDCFRDGRTALQEVCSWDGERAAAGRAVAAVLLHHGARPSLPTHEGWTALHIASVNPDSQLLPLLLATRTISKTAVTSIACSQK